MLSSKIWKTLSRTILTFASVHLVVLLIYAISSGEWAVLNVLHILELELLFPALREWELIWPASFVLLAGVIAGHWLKARS